VNNRPKLSKAELLILSSPFPNVSHQSQLENFLFLNDSANRETIYRRFDKMALMGQVSFVHFPFTTLFFCSVCFIRVFIRFKIIVVMDLTIHLFPNGLLGRRVMWYMRGKEGTSYVAIILHLLCWLFLKKP
jgi:hypothetical protein